MLSSQQQLQVVSLLARCLPLARCSLLPATSHLPQAQHPSASSNAWTKTSQRRSGVAPEKLFSSCPCTPSGRLSSHGACLPGSLCSSSSSSTARASTLEHKGHLKLHQWRCLSSPAAAGNPTPSAAPSDPEPGQQQQQQPLAQGMRDLLKVLCQPLPMGSVRNRALNDAVVSLNGVLFLDPHRMLESTMRALYVVKQVLRLNGHVCVFNSNPAFVPLMRHVARHSTNSHMWWVTDPYAAGTLLQRPARVMTAAAQPARARLRARGLAMGNVHCPAPDVLDKPAPRLEAVDKWRLWGTKATTPSGLRGRHILRRLVADEVHSVRLLLPGAGNQQAAPTLIMVLDLSHDEQVVRDAHEAGILTSGVVNAHSELDRITYPILAAEAHPTFTHFLLDWLLKVSNLPTPPLPTPAAGADGSARHGPR